MLDMNSCTDNNNAHIINSILSFLLQTPSAIDECLKLADEQDVQVTIHTDTLNESGYVDDTLRAIGGRTIHAYHTEGAGGGREYLNRYFRRN